MPPIRPLFATLHPAWVTGIYGVSEYLFGRQSRERRHQIFRAAIQR